MSSENNYERSDRDSSSRYKDSSWRDNKSGHYRDDRNRDAHYNRNRDDRNRDTHYNRSRDPQGNSTRSEYTETIEIPYDKVGKIIGKGGSNIRDIQTTFAVTAKVDKTSYSGNTNSVRVSGNKEDVERAVERIKQQAEEEQRPRRNDRYGGSFGGNYSNED